MKIVVHAGMDKAGSTAIQAFLNFYREQLMGLGIYVPTTGLTGFGHIALLESPAGETWPELHRELDQPQARASQCVVLSWEGVFFYRPEQVKALAAQLEPYDTQIFFYLRNQVDVIQSGYLQKLKGARQKHLLSHFSTEPTLLEPPGRNYLRVFRKFEAAFGRDALRGRVYDRADFPRGSVIYDFMNVLGFGEESYFPMPEQNTNVSLDVPSAQLLNLFDTLSHDKKAREKLVNELLLNIAVHGAEQQWFLGEEQVQHIVQHYAASNAELNRRYAIRATDSAAALFGQAQAASQIGASSQLLSHLSQQLTHAVWDGDAVSGDSLHTLLLSGQGWSVAGEDGVWSVGEKSTIKFRLPVARAYRPTRDIEIGFVGQYLATPGGERPVTGVRIAGSSIGELNLEQASIVLKPSQLQGLSRVEIELLHNNPQAPSALYDSEDDRLLCYRLRSLSYRVL